MRTATIFVKPCIHVKAIKRLFVHIFMALLKSWSQSLKHSQPRSCLPSGGERSCCISFHTLSPPTHNHHCAVSFSSVGRPSRATWRVSHHRGNYVKLFFFLPNNMFSTRFISTPSDFSMVFDPPLWPLNQRVLLSTIIGFRQWLFFLWKKRGSVIFSTPPLNFHAFCTCRL